MANLLFYSYLRYSPSINASVSQYNLLQLAGLLEYLVDSKIVLGCSFVILPRRILLFSWCLFLAPAPVLLPLYFFLEGHALFCLCGMALTLCNCCTHLPRGSASVKKRVVVKARACAYGKRLCLRMRFVRVAEFGVVGSRLGV